MTRMLKQKSNIPLGSKVILPELRLKNKNINYIRNISIFNNNINRDSNRLMQMKNNKHLIKENYKQLNENLEQRKSDNYNYQNLKVVNLNIIEPKKINIKKSLFRIRSPNSINRNYIENDKILNNEKNYRYYNHNNKKLGSLPKKNIILNINL